MDMSLKSWISELEMDDYFIDQCPTHSNEFAEFVQLVSTPELDENFLPPLSPKSITTTVMASATVTNDCSFFEISGANFERPPKQLKTMTPNATISGEQQCNKNVDGPKRPNIITRTSLEAHDRVMAERKRREKLSQCFIALSSMVPGLKKMDKASVLGDAIKYLKQLQECTKSLEEKLNKKSKESVAFVRKSQLCNDDDTPSCDENFDGHAIPEIEVRISENSVLIRILCEKQKGFAVKLQSEIEKLHLNVVSSSFLPFGLYAINITVVAQMDAGFNITVEELVRNLRSAFMKFM